MLNQELKLNTKMFDDPSNSSGQGKVDMIPIRQGFGEGLLKAGEEDKNVVALCADLTDSTKMNLFKERFPERFVEIGVAEQNLATVASGMAAMGKIPYVSSYAMFSPGRNWEQIRTTIAYNDQHVIIAGSHAGVSVGPDGGTHQAIEDMAIMRVIPNMIVVSPCDAIEAKKATIALKDAKSPAYIRLAREKTPIMTTEDTPFEIGKGQIVFLPESGLAEIGIIATGALVHKAIMTAKELEKEGRKVKVLNISTIKPLDTEAVIALAREAKKIVTVEEHQVAGGLGSAVAECLAENYPVPMRFIGVHDKFGQSGTPEELIAHYGMEVKDILKVSKELLK